MKAKNLKLIKALSNNARTQSQANALNKIK